VLVQLPGNVSNGLRTLKTRALVLFKRQKQLSVIQGHVWTEDMVEDSFPRREIVMEMFSRHRNSGVEIEGRAFPVQSDEPGIRNFNLWQVQAVSPSLCGLMRAVCAFLP
jgi:hypothetical protein